MKTSTWVLAVLLAVMAGTAHSEELKILGFNTENIETLDSSGKVISEVPVTALPKPEIVVLEHNKTLDLVKINNKAGEPVWLDVYFLKLNQGKVVDLPCHKLAETGEVDRHETGTMGFGGRCEKES